MTNYRLSLQTVIGGFCLVYKYQIQKTIIKGENIVKYYFLNGIILNLHIEQIVGKYASSSSIFLFTYSGSKYRVSMNGLRSSKL